MAKRSQLRPGVRDSAYYERIGLQVEMDRLVKQAAELRRRLQKFPAWVRDRLQVPASGEAQSRATVKSVAAKPARRKGVMSAEGRRRIAEAQRARWAKHRAASGGQSAAAPAAGEAVQGARKPSGRAAGRAASGATTRRAAKKRTISPEGRKRIAEAQKRRWAAIRKKKKS